MLHILWLAPALPLVSAIVLAVFGSRLSRKGSYRLLGVGSIGASGLVARHRCLRLSPSAAACTAMFVQRSLDMDGYRRRSVRRLRFYLDSVSLVMMLVVTFVGFLIHLYSTDYMRDDEGYSRFFAYMNLFVASMLILVLGNNLLLLYLGWEGVGLCSYLLIGFWYRDPANVRGGSQGVHRHARRRYGDGHRPVSAVHNSWALWTFRN